MKKKSLSAKNKNHNTVTNFLKDKLINSIYKQFEKNLVPENGYIVAVSGGPDSLALAYFAKCFSQLKKVNFYYYLVDHRLRKESSKEAKKTLDLLKKINVKCKVLIWKGKKPKSNIQSIARFNRYSLLIKECKKKNLNNILLGHQNDDLNENFLIRMMRGSGLKGLVSMDEISESNNIKFLRPLLSIEKNKLKMVSLKVFKSFIEDPSNINENFKRIRVRNLIKNLEKEGFDKKKFNLTINNLKSANKALEFYAKRNILENSFFNSEKHNIILNKDFFVQPNEIILRSFIKVIQTISRNYYPPRGKSVKNLIIEIKSKKSKKKFTLGGCILEKINETVIISKE